MRKVARLQKNKSNGIKYCVLREGFCTPSVKTESTQSDSPVGAVSYEEIRAVLMEKSPITAVDLVKNFSGRLESKKVCSIYRVLVRNC